MSSLRPMFLLAIALFVAAATFLTRAITPTAAGPHHADDAAADFRLAAVAFEREMRALWEDHAAWTRLYIVSVAADLPDQAVTARRLLRNQVEIGDAIKPFYGEEAGDALTALLTDHILGAADLLVAAKAGDQEKVEEAAAAWYANGDAIAAFLNAANPDHWPLTDLQVEMKRHLDLTLIEAEARLQGDWEADVVAYDDAHQHILALADMLSAGIIGQFPDRFA